MDSLTRGSIPARAAVSGLPTVAMIGVDVLVAAAFVAGNPYIVLLAVVLAVVLMLATTLPFEHVLVMYMVVLLMVPSVVQIVVGGYAVTGFRVLAPLLFALFLVRVAAGQEHFRRSPIDLLLLAYFIILAVGLVVTHSNWGSIVAKTGLAKIITLLVEYVAVFYLVFWTARTAEKRRRLVAALVIIAACIGAYAVLEFATGHNWLNSLNTGAGKQQLVRYVFSRADLTRARATFEHPIALGTGLAMILPLAFHLAGCAQTAMRRALAYGAAASIGMGVLACGSRGPFVAVVLGTLTFFAMERRQGVRLKLAAGVVAMAVLAVVFAGPILTRLSSTFVIDMSITTRLVDYPAIWRIVSGHPLFGIGLGGLNAQSYGYVDNYYLTTLGESGIIGILLLVLLLGRILYVLWKSARFSSLGPIADERSPGETRSLVAALIAATIVFLFQTGTFDSFTFSKPSGLFWIITGIGMAVWVDVSSRWPGPGEPDHSSSSAPLPKSTGP